jgi:hypothetical protein
MPAPVRHYSIVIKGYTHCFYSLSPMQYLQHQTTDDCNAAQTVTVCQERNGMCGRQHLERVQTRCRLITSNIKSRSKIRGPSLTTCELQHRKARFLSVVVRVDAANVPRQSQTRGLDHQRPAQPCPRTPNPPSC